MQARNLLKLTLIILVISFSNNANALVKKSKSGICHDTYSAYYDRTKNYTSFSTLQSCLDSGGRLPKNYKGSYQRAKSPVQIVDHDNKYSRSQFGNGWADLDRDCQNSRMETLIAYSVSPVKFKSSKKCKVKSGKWISSFSGKEIYSASEIDIDHVVPLSWAWKHGANSWSKSKRVKFANDPANLISVEASLNRQKGDKGINEWLPPKNKCQYISRFLRVQKSYGLKLSNSETKRFKEIRNSHCL